MTHTHISTWLIRKYPHDSYAHITRTYPHDSYAHIVMTHTHISSWLIRTHYTHISSWLIRTHYTHISSWLIRTHYTHISSPSPSKCRFSKPCYLCFTKFYIHSFPYPLYTRRPYRSSWLQGSSNNIWFHAMQLISSFLVPRFIYFSGQAFKDL